jgi:hypothetical protein
MVDHLVNQFVQDITNYIGFDEQSAFMQGPDPLDKTISKRHWEESVKQWRRDLRAASESVCREVSRASLTSCLVFEPRVA